MTGLYEKLKRKNKGAWVTVISVISAIAVYGINAFIKRGFPGYMFMKNSFVFFDYDEPRVYFFADHLAIVLLFIVIGGLVVKLLSHKIKNEGGEEHDL